MRKNRYFWGILLIIIGILFFLQTLGILRFDVGSLIFPIFIILVGGFLIFRSMNRNEVSSLQQLNIPSAQFKHADLELHHGAGRIFVTNAADNSYLLKGTFSNGVKHNLVDHGASASLLVEPPENWAEIIPFGGINKGFEWNIELSPDIVYNLALKTGAGETHLNFGKLKIADIRLETGASATKIFLPQAAGFTNLIIHAGMASVEVIVPGNVAAQIKNKSGFSGIKIDSNRFDPHGDGLFSSVGFDQAENKVRIEIEGGFGSFEIR